MENPDIAQRSYRTLTFKYTTLHISGEGVARRSLRAQYFRTSFDKRLATDKTVCDTNFQRFLANFTN